MPHIDTNPPWVYMCGYNFRINWLRVLALERKKKQALLVFPWFTEEQIHFIFLFMSVHPALMCQDPACSQGLPPQPAGSAQARPYPHSRGLLLVLDITVRLQARAMGPAGTGAALHRCQGGLGATVLPTQTRLSLPRSKAACHQGPPFPRGPAPSGVIRAEEVRRLCLWPSHCASSYYCLFYQDRNWVSKWQITCPVCFCLQSQLDM